MVQGKVQGQKVRPTAVSHAGRVLVSPDSNPVEESKDEPGQVKTTNLDSNAADQRSRWLDTSAFEPGFSDDDDFGNPLQD